MDLDELDVKGRRDGFGFGDGGPELIDDAMRCLPDADAEVDGPACALPGCCAALPVWLDDRRNNGRAIAAAILLLLDCLLSGCGRAGSVKEDEAVVLPASEELGMLCDVSPVELMLDELASIRPAGNGTYAFCGDPAGGVI